MTNEDYELNAEIHRARENAEARDIGEQKALLASYKRARARKDDRFAAEVVERAVTGEHDCSYRERMWWVARRAKLRAK